MFLNPEKCGFCQGKLDAYDEGYQANGCSRCQVKYDMPELSYTRIISKYQHKLLAKRDYFILQIGQYQVEYSEHITYIAKLLIIDKDQKYITAPNLLQFDFIVPFDLTDEDKCINRIHTLINFQ